MTTTQFDPRKIAESAIREYERLRDTGLNRDRALQSAVSTVSTLARHGADAQEDLEPRLRGGAIGWCTNCEMTRSAGVIGQCTVCGERLLSEGA